MNRATQIAIEIIEDKEKNHIVPACAMWVEIYLKAGAFDINGEQMTRQLHEGVERGYLLRRRGLNGDIYERRGK